MGNGIQGRKVLQMYQILVQLTLISTLALWLPPNQVFSKAPEILRTSLVTKPDRGWNQRLVLEVDWNISWYCMLIRHQEVSWLLL